MISEETVKNLLGIAQKAGYVVSGDFAVKESFKKNVFLLILANDISLNSEKELLLLAKKKNIPVLKILSKSDMGSSIGKGTRSSIAVINEKFARALEKKINK